MNFILYGQYDKNNIIILYNSYTLSIPHISYKMYREDILETKSLNALCVTLCTDESTHTDVDSHFVHIPKSLFIQYTTNLNINSMCFELSNPINPTGPKVYLKKIEPSMGEFESNILLPDWVCKNLSIQMCGDKIDIIPITIPHKIKRCKIRGNNSSYVKMDIKTLLEDKINKFKCVNLNTTFTINKIKFTIVELISTADKVINYGITTDELEIDFDTPDDIKFAERRKTITEKITKKIEDKINSINEFKNKFNAKKTGIFKFNDYMESQLNTLTQFNPNMDWDEINTSLSLEIEKEFASDLKELEENKKILQDLVDEGKKIQNALIENKKNPSTCATDTTCSTNTTCSTCTTDTSKSNIFNTKAYKLNDNTDSDSIESKPIIMTKDEIRKARLEKLTKKD